MFNDQKGDELAQSGLSKERIVQDMSTEAGKGQIAKPIIKKVPDSSV